MADGHDEFVGMVKRLEGISKREPGAYRFKLGSLAVLGYGYITVVLLALLAVIGLMVLFTVKTGRFYGGEIKIFLFLIIMVIVILRSLWVTVPAPEGLPIRREDVPELFRMIDEVAQQLRAPRLSHVLLTTDMNAAIAQVPRLGLFGWYVNYLVIGLPLLQAVTPEQFRAILAHEMGHLSEQHGRFSVWIWRMRATWGRLMDGLSSGGHNTFLFDAFLKWYGPRFMAYSFVLARADEYAADRYAAQLTSPRTAAEALVAFRVRDNWLDKAFWPALNNEIKASPTPPSDPFVRMGETLRQPLPPDDAHKWLSLALAQQTDYDDTHPALCDRLGALGFQDITCSPEALQALLPANTVSTAAEALLGPALPHLTEELNQRWHATVAPIWEEYHQQAQSGMARLEELEGQAAQGPLAQAEAWERARLTAELRGNEAAVPLLEVLLAAWPDFPPAQYAMGTIRLQAEDETGIALINQAMDADVDFILPGCQAVYGYLKQRGRDAEAEPYRKRALQQVEVLQQEEMAANQVLSSDTFTAPELPEEVVERFRAVVREIPEVQEAHLVRKAIPSQPDRVVHVLAIKPRFKGLVLDETKAANNLLQRVLAGLNTTHEVLVIINHGSANFIDKKVKQLPEARIYVKGK